MNNPILKYSSKVMCNKCKANDWQITDNKFECISCKHTYFFNNNKLISIDNHIEDKNWEEEGDGFDPFEANAEPVYSLLSSLKIDKIGGPRIKDLRKNLNVEGLSINLGSGQDNYEGFLNVDLGNYEPVHLVADLTDMPLIGGSVELIASNSVLEHIYDYQAVIDEAHRILNTGGYFYLCVPCFEKRHHKYDYHRWTTPGLHKLLEDRFEIIDGGACRGVAYSISNTIEALMGYKIKNKMLLALARFTWRIVSRPLWWIKDDATEEYQAMANTIYVLARKL